MPSYFKDISLLSNCGWLPNETILNNRSIGRSSWAHRPALILLFAKKFFRPASAGRMRWIGQIFWLLAFDPAPAGLTFFPPSPLIFQGLAHREVVSSYSSATAPDSHGISCVDPLFQARKELERQLPACAPRFKIYLINQPTRPFLCHRLTLR
jgi:hypothetical protein